jgi:hypothetical protein
MRGRAISSLPTYVSEAFCRERAGLLNVDEWPRNALDTAYGLEYAGWQN